MTYWSTFVPESVNLDTGRFGFVRSVCSFLVPILCSPEPRFCLSLANHFAAIHPVKIRSTNHFPSMENKNPLTQEDGTNSPLQPAKVIAKKRKYRKAQNVYTVDVILVPVTEEQARIKLAGIENVIKKSYFK